MEAQWLDTAIRATGVFRQMGLLAEFAIA